MYAHKHLQNFYDYTMSTLNIIVIKYNQVK